MSGNLWMFSDMLDDEDTVATSFMRNRHLPIMSRTMHIITLQS